MPGTGSARRPATARCGDAGRRSTSVGGPGVSRGPLCATGGRSAQASFDRDVDNRLRSSAPPPDGRRARRSRGEAARSDQGAGGGAWRGEGVGRPVDERRRPRPRRGRRRRRCGRRPSGPRPWDRRRSWTERVRMRAIRRATSLAGAPSQGLAPDARAWFVRPVAGSPPRAARIGGTGPCGLSSNASVDRHDRIFRSSVPPASRAARARRRCAAGAGLGSRARRTSGGGAAREFAPTQGSGPSPQQRFAGRPERRRIGGVTRDEGGAPPVRGRAAMIAPARAPRSRDPCRRSALAEYPAAGGNFG